MKAYYESQRRPAKYDLGGNPQNRWMAKAGRNALRFDPRPDRYELIHGRPPPPESPPPPPPRPGIKLGADLIYGYPRIPPVAHSFAELDAQIAQARSAVLGLNPGGESR